MKASEKQELTKKVIARLEKQFGRPPSEPDRTVLETLLLAVCLENESPASAARALDALQSEFHDLNEIRVSAISELLVAFTHQADPHLRAHRVRTILQFVFEDQFEFDLEALRKKTQDQAVRKLGHIRDLSPFIRNYVQQAALSTHVLPLDDRQTAVVIWLGLVEPGTTPEAASEQLKAAVRKADGPTLCHLLRRFATESASAKLFAPGAFSVPKDGFSPSDAVKRVDDALRGKTSPASKSKSSKSARSPKASAAKSSRSAKTKKAPKRAATSKTTAKSRPDKSQTDKTRGAKKKAVKKTTTTKRAKAKKPAKGRSRATS